jgi:V/A-type H+-transporting ATPase subunit D
MHPSDYPTKFNLQQARLGLSLARRGHNLLDKKHKALLAHMRAAQETARRLRAESAKNVGLAYEALAKAHLDMGRDEVTKYRRPLNGGDGLPFPLAGTAASLDEAYLTWQAAKGILKKLAEAEAVLRRLLVSIRKTQKRAAALGNVIIPVYETRIRYIQAQLEERDRDELARLKAARRFKK